MNYKSPWKCMTVKLCLEKNLITFPKSYTPKQIKSLKRILKRFEDISLHLNSTKTFQAHISGTLTHEIAEKIRDSFNGSENAYIGIFDAAGKPLAEGSTIFNLCALLIKPEGLIVINNKNTDIRAISYPQSSNNRHAKKLIRHEQKDCFLIFAKAPKQRKPEFDHALAIQESPLFPIRK